MLSFRRLREIAGILFEYELHHLIALLELKAHLPFHHRFEQPKQWTTQPETLRRVFEQLGGAFIKLGQLLALRPDLVGKAYSKEFEKLLADVPPEEFETIQYATKHIPLQHLEKLPLGSGSIAQVHKAKLHGKTVAIKIKRPDIEKRFEEDIHIMEYLARKLVKTYHPTYADPIRIVEEFKRYTEKELDMLHEAANMKRFAHNFKNTSIIIPQVIDKYTNHQVLVMSYEQGTTILDATIPKKERKEIINQVTQAVYKMLFEDRFFHADLHPGNIYVRKKRLIFLDFGIIGHIDRAMERKLFKLFSGLVNGNIEQTTQALLDINISTEEPDIQALKDGLYDVLGDYYNQPLHTMEFSRIFYGAIDVARQSRIKMPAHLVLFGKSLVTMEGFCREIDPNFNIVKNAKPFVRRLIQKETSPKAIVKKTKESATVVYDTAMRLPEMVDDFSRKFGIIEQRVIDIDKTFHRLIHQLWKIGKLMSMSIIFATVMVVALLLVSTGAKWGNISIISYICWGIAIVLLLGILRIIAHNDEH